jgi:hypothetical protein
MGFHGTRFLLAVLAVVVLGVGIDSPLHSVLHSDSVGLLITDGCWGRGGMALVGKVAGVAITINYSDRSVGDMKTVFIYYV